MLEGPGLVLVWLRRDILRYIVLVLDVYCWIAIYLVSSSLPADCGCRPRSRSSHGISRRCAPSRMIARRRHQSDWQGTQGSTLMKDPDALVHGAGRGHRAGRGQRRGQRGQRRGRLVGLQLVGHILIVVDDKCRTMLPHPVCINRLVVNLPAPSSHVFSYASRSRSTSPRPPLPRHPVHRPRPFIPLHMSPPGREALASVKGKERGAIAGRMTRIMPARRRREDPRKPTRKPCGR